VDSLDLGNKSARMSMLHSFYCWGELLVVIISTTVIKIFNGNAWWIMTLCWAVIPVINAILFTIVYIPEIGDEVCETPKSLLRSRTFITMCLLMTCAGAAEIAMAQWASLFAQKGLGVTKFVGDMLGPGMFALFMGSGRLLFGIFGGRLNLQRSLIFCSMLCAMCYITAAVSKNPYTALMGCSITGFSVSIMWPGVYSYSSRMIPTGGTAMFSILALFGDIGCSLGAWLCGVASDFSQKLSVFTGYADRSGITYEQMGLKFGIGISALFPIIMIVLLFLTKRNIKL
ncbi:MAG: MFS transporter, partial [Clostridiales bacterium]|nr:MFS transporter [Clostridiales bacterium]